MPAIEVPQQMPTPSAEQPQLDLMRRTLAMGMEEDCHLKCSSHRRAITAFVRWQSEHNL